MEPREKARSYEETSSVHTIYNRYVQKSIKRWFKSKKKPGWGRIISGSYCCSARESVTPLKLHKAGHTGDWVVEKSNKLRYQRNELVALDPFCTETNLYHLLHRNDTKNCPQKVTRCEYCKILFINADIVLIKTKVKGQFTSPKTGRGKYHVANVYLHYLQSCLKGYDGKFRFESVVLLKETMSRLPKSASERFAKQILQMEK